MTLPLDASAPSSFVCRTTHAVVDPLSRVTSVGVVPARCSPVPVTLTCTVMLEDGALSAVMVNPTSVPSVTDAASAAIVNKALGPGVGVGGDTWLPEVPGPDGTEAEHPSTALASRMASPNRVTATARRVVLAAPTVLMPMDSHA